MTNKDSSGITIPYSEDIAVNGYTIPAGYYSGGKIKLSEDWPYHIDFRENV